MRFRLQGILPLVASLWLLPAAAGTADAEIQQLLEATGRSECTFIRNGNAHAAAEAEAHLRMKYGRGKQWVSTAEQFIDRIASKSTWTGKPYFIDCPNAVRRIAGDWFGDQLDVIRAQSDREPQARQSGQQLKPTRLSEAPLPE